MLQLFELPSKHLNFVKAFVIKQALVSKELSCVTDCASVRGSHGQYSWLV